MIFPNRRAIFGFNKLLCHARSHHLGQAVYVGGIDATTRLNRLTHGIGPRLRPKNTEPQFERRGIDALPLDFVGNIQHIRWRNHDDVRLEIAQKLHLLLGLATRHRNHGTAQLLGAVMRSESASKKPITVRDLYTIPRAPTGCLNRARDAGCPMINIVFGITDHRRFAGGTARGMNSHHLTHRHAEKPKGIVLS